MTQTSAVDPTVFPDNVDVDKAQVRATLQAAKDELDQLFKDTSVARQVMFGKRNFNFLT